MSTLAVCYGLAWVALVGLLVGLRRRQRRVGADLAELERRLRREG